MGNGIDEKNKEGNKKIWKRIKIVMRVVLYIGVLIFVLAVFPWNIFDLTEKITIAQIGTSLGAVISLLLIFQQLRNQEKRLQNQEEQLQNQKEQIKLQIDQRVDDRFTTSVELLGNMGTSTRTGAIYSLYQLAVEDEKYRSQIVQILCSYVRSKTHEEESLQKSKDPLSNKISNEIQTTINLLVREDHNIKGLYCQDFKKELPRLDFTHAYLVGADFSGAQCRDVNFAYAQCKGANFSKAGCQEADFSSAECQETDFSNAECQEADFSNAQCKGANFKRAQCQNIRFIEAQCQDADFSKAECQGADFSFAQYQGASFRGAQYQNTNFVYAQCQDANFAYTQCQDANFAYTQCQGASFIEARCQGASFFAARCQGADFKYAQCQGANFGKAECQGAYSAGNYQSLSNRIDKPTELKNIIIAGELSREDIRNIEEAKEYCSEDWYKKMQVIIDDNKGKGQERGVPEGIIEGILEDSEEIQAIIHKDWEKAGSYFSEKRNISLPKLVDSAHAKEDSQLAYQPYNPNTDDNQSRRQSMNKPLKAFITYSHKNKAEREQLIAQFAVMKRNGELETWYDGKISGGDSWNKKIANNLAESDILIYLVSAASLVSDACNDEIRTAINRGIRVIPVILEACDWKKDQQIAGLQALPKDGKPINTWSTESEGWQNVIDGIRKTITDIDEKEDSDSFFNL